MKTDGYLVAESEGKALYQDEENNYFFVENNIRQVVEIDEAQKWLDTAFIQIQLDVDEDDWKELKDQADKLNMTVDCYITRLLEQQFALSK